MQEMTNNNKIMRTSRLVFPGEVTTGPITQTVLKKLAKMADEDKMTPSDLAR
jgi:hypothetical protein